MRITTNSFYETFNSQLQRLSGDQAQVQSQIATGLRVRNPSDDPAAVTRVLNNETEALRIQQFQRSTRYAKEISQVSFSSLSEIKKISDRAGEIGLLAAGPISQESAKTYAAEVDQLLEQVLRVANSNYQGQYLFGGTKSDQPPFLATRNANGETTSVAYQGAASGPEFRIDEGLTLSAFTEGSANQKLADFANTLATLRDTLRAPGAPDRATAMLAIQQFEDGLLENLGSLGARQTRLESNETQLNARFASLQELVSSDIDTDLGLSMVRLSRTTAAYQAALQSSAQILKTSLLDYLR